MNERKKNHIFFLILFNVTTERCKHTITTPPHEPGDRYVSVIFGARELRHDKQLALNQSIITLQL